MTVAEVDKSGYGGVDSGTSLSSKEVTPRDGVIEEQDDKVDMKKEIEENLDIDLEDPDVVKATTKIQAGFRGAMTRKTMKDKKKEKDDPASSRIVKTPEIVVDKGSSSGSEYTYEYTYVEESEGEEESESLTERPDSPLTAIAGKVGMNIWLMIQDAVLTLLSFYSTNTLL